MTISFNTIPSNTLVPLFYAEMDNQAANTAQDSGASLLIGHANNGAEIVANSLVLMPSADYARQICGAGSQLARMVEAYRQTDPFGELYVIAVPESTGAAATVTLTVTGAATETGTVNVYVGRTRVQAPVTIAGRSLTADLIDCAAEPTQFNGRSLVQIAQALAAPFGIEVVNSGAPSGVIPDVQPDHGETVIEVINKILGQQQALAYDDPHGRLVIGGIGSTRAHTALVLGENILSCDTEKSIRERFSVYQVAGQRAGNDDDFGEATTTALRARTEDAFIARYRPMYIRQTGQATGAGCIARADFEARQRAARTDETTYVVQGWRQGNGTLWQPNQRVIVFDPVCGFDNTELLVSEVTFTQDQNGTLTEIRVGPPDAYLPEPEAPGARKKKKARVQEDPF